MFRSSNTPWLRRSLLGVALTLIACLGLQGLWNPPFVQGLDQQVYDARLRRQEAGRSSDVVIVDVDERSLGEIGRWPWRRSDVAQLTRLLASRGEAAVIGFDVLFAEQQTELNEDRALAEAIMKAPVVMGYYLSSDRGGLTSNDLPMPVLDSRAVSQLNLSITDWTGYGANIPILQNRARGAGFFNPIIDPDGVIRMLPLLGRYKDEVYESFAVAVLRQYLGSASLLLRHDRLELHGQRGDARIPISDGLAALVPFARLRSEQLQALPVRIGGRPGSGRFLTLSAGDVLRERVDWSLLKGKIVLIGTSAPGLTDLRATPISETLPGVEIHAALIASALASQEVSTPVIRQRPPEADLISTIAIGAVGVAVSFALPLMGAVGMLLIGTLAVTALIVWNWIAYWNFGWELPSAIGLLLVAAITVLNLALGYLVEGRARKAVSGLFGEYVSPALVDRMTRDPRRFSRMTSENRELTIMFTDIRGFTRIAESMEPADLREFINEFLTSMTEVIYRYNGTVDKYIGDAVMAFWGAPLDDPAHADQAVSSALAMLAEVERLNDLNIRRGWPQLVIGIGINTGVARVGDMGSKLRRAYTVLGDAVNLASRIESLTKQFGTPIIVGESTTRRCRAHSFSQLAQVSIAGRNEQVRIYVPAALANTRPLTESEMQSLEPPRDSADEGQSLRV